MVHRPVLTVLKGHGLHLALLRHRVVAFLVLLGPGHLTWEPLPSRVVLAVLPARRRPLSEQFPILAQLVLRARGLPLVPLNVRAVPQVHGPPY